MLNRHLYILLFGIVMLSTLKAEGQASMPDNVCIGQFRHYYVDYNPGSTYKWWIDGILQEGYSTNEFFFTWNTSKTYLLEVQEQSADGCEGEVRSENIIVAGPIQNELIIPEAFSPNGDLINDLWKIGNIDFYPQAEITIYNRWGQLVWKSERGYPQPWNGKSNGADLPVDSYHYVIDLHNDTKPLIGVITIVK